MMYSGFCTKQNKNYQVEFTQLSASSLEDKNYQTGVGEIESIKFKGSEMPVEFCETE